jgi:hypothetical protein
MEANSAFEMLHVLDNFLGSPDLNVWQYDETKTLAYLAEKVHRVARQLTSQDGSPNGILT